MNISLFSCRPAAHAALMTLLALLAGCGGGYGSGGMTNTPKNVTISGAILPTLATMTTIGSALDPTEHGGNPYGLTVATATAGLITMGDLIVCNFNDGATNTQGLGTTVIGLRSPRSCWAAPHSRVFRTGASLQRPAKPTARAPRCSSRRAARSRHPSQPMYSPSRGASFMRPTRAARPCTSRMPPLGRLTALH